MARPVIQGMLLLLANAAACSSGDNAATHTPRAPRDFPDPSGYYVRSDSPGAAFSVSRLANGSWVVETEGAAPPGGPANACWGVYVGSLAGSRLVSTSDLGLDFGGDLTEEGLSHYQGFIVHFDGARARVSGPEARQVCDRRGTYERRSAPRHRVL